MPMALTKKQRTILDAVLYLIRAGEVPTVREVASLVGLRSASTALKHLRALRDAGLITLSGKSRGIRIVDRELLRDLARELQEAPETAGAPEDAEAASRPTDQSSLLQLHSARDGAGEPARGYELIPVLGRIAAGPPTDTQTEAYRPAATLFETQPGIRLDPRLFCASGDLVAVRVEGNSMVDVGICDGDYAIVRRQESVEEGEIAAVLIDGQATLKRWYSTGVENRRARNRRRTVADPESPSSFYGRSRGAFDVDREFAEEREDAELEPRESRPPTVRLEPENRDYDPLEITEVDRKEVLIVGKYVGLVRGVQVL